MQRRIRRRVAGALAAAMTGVTASVALAAPAGAVTTKHDSRTVDFAFTTADGVATTCQIAISSEWVPSSHELTVTTGVLGTDPNCVGPYNGLETAASAVAHYTNVAGASSTAAAVGGTRVLLQVHDAASAVEGRHDVYFASCDCSSPTYLTAPK